VESGLEDGGGLLVAGGQATPVLQAVDAAFDGVALLVGLAVEGGRAASEPAFALAVGDLVGGLRDHRPDSAPAQVLADGA